MNEDWALMSNNRDKKKDLSYHINHINQVHFFPNKNNEEQNQLLQECFNIKLTQ